MGHRQPVARQAFINLSCRMTAFPRLAMEGATGPTALLPCFTQGHFWGYFFHFRAVTTPGTPKRKAPETLGFRGFLVVAGCGLEPQT
jgi:hypothetical protein